MMSLDQTPINQLITDNIDTWTSTVKTKATTGRGSSKKLELYGVKKLRELILELAVRGKLLPQDPSDEPASVLLERITEEKAQLVKEKKIKKPKKLPEIEKVKPFELPSGWEWSQLGFLTNYGVCDKVESTDVINDTWVLELEDVEKETSKLLKKVRFSERHFKSSKNMFEKNDVVYGKLRPYLDKVLIADESGVCTTEMIPVRAYCNLTPSFLRLVLKSPYFIRYANDSTHGMNLPRMGTDKARAALFPLAPVEEQHRIVAKVDELMTLCDQLEQQTEASIAAHQVLVTTLLDTLTNSANAEELMQNWQLVAEHFDTLFTTEESIDQLKQTILQLAVMGKLVPQDPNDEPASKLLERIAEEKAHLIKEKKIKKQKALPPIADDDKPFELSSGWEWCYLQQLFSVVTDGDHQAPPKADRGVPFLVIGNLNTGTIKFEACKFVPDSYYQKLDWTRQPVKGDLLYTVTGSYGIPIVVTENKPFCVQRHVAILNSTKNTPIEFIRYVLLSKYSFDFATSVATGIAQKTVPLSGLRRMPVPLPPKNEVVAILEKIEVMMSICDQLKTDLKESQTAQLHLTDAIVEQAV